MKKWLEVWQENYENKSDIAKWVMSTTKDTYKGDAYVPWGNMLHALYALDENADVVKVQNESGGFVHTDEMKLHTENDGKTTISTIVSHLVMVKVKFMDKWFTEVYPIQEKDYGASKVYDQNKVNKALQRALARCISLATGIAWSLYENSAGQFEDDTPTPPAKPTLKTATKKAETTITTPEPVQELTGNDVLDLVGFIAVNKENPKVLGLVDKFNTILSSKYTFEDKPLILDIANDSADILKAKLETVANPSTMLDALRKVVK